MGEKEGGQRERVSEQARSEEWRLEGEERRERVRREGRTTSHHCLCREKDRLDSLNWRAKKGGKRKWGGGQAERRGEGGEQELGEGIGASKGMWAEEGTLGKEGLQ